MRAVMACNTIIKSVFAMCVTAAAIWFNNASVLWWYMVLPFIGYEYKETPIKKGETNEASK